MPKKIAIIVESKYVNPKKTDWYIDQVLKENEILELALAKRDLVLSA